MNKAKKVFLVPSTIALFSLRLWCEVAWWIDWRVMKSCQSNTPSLNRQLYTLVKNACRRVLLSKLFRQDFYYTYQWSITSVKTKQHFLNWGDIFRQYQSKYIAGYTYSDMGSLTWVKLVHQYQTFSRSSRQIMNFKCLTYAKVVFN